MHEVNCESGRDHYSTVAQNALASCTLQFRYLAAPERPSILCKAWLHQACLRLQTRLEVLTRAGQTQRDRIWTILHNLVQNASHTRDTYDQTIAQSSGKAVAIPLVITIKPVNNVTHGLRRDMCS